MPKPFSVRKATEGDLSILSPEGYLDAHTAPEFERTIQEEIAGGRCRIVADCQKLDYISSAGLGVFMGFIEEIRDQGGDIKICGLAPKVRQVFELLGFDAVFDLVEDLPAVVRKFAESPTKEV